MKWQKCCRGRRSECPEIAIDGQYIHIKDDFGGMIVLTLDQFQDVRWKIEESVSRRLNVAKPGITHVDA
jgi:hypothetical protein